MLICDEAFFPVSDSAGLHVLGAPACVCGCDSPGYV